MRSVVKLTVLFVASFSIGHSFARGKVPKQPPEPVSSELKVEIPTELESSQTKLSQNVTLERRSWPFENFVLGLGYSEDHATHLPSSTPQFVSFESTLTPRIWAELDTRPLFTGGRTSIPAFVFFETNHRISQAEVLVNGKTYPDRLHLFTQTLGAGFEWKLRVLTGEKNNTHLAAAASFARSGGFTTKGLRSETMSYWGNQQNYALRVYQKLSSLNLLLEFARTRDQLSSSDQWLNGIKLGVVKDL